MSTLVLRPPQSAACPAAALPWTPMPFVAPGKASRRGSITSMPTLCGARQGVPAGEYHHT